MTNNKIRGLQNKQELNEEFLVRDTRSSLKKFIDWMSIPNNMGFLFIIQAALAFLIPSIADILLIIGFLFLIFAYTRSETAPLKMPIQSQILDPHQPHPATGKPSTPEGIFF